MFYALLGPTSANSARADSSEATRAKSTNLAAARGQFKTQTKVQVILSPQRVSQAQKVALLLTFVMKEIHAVRNAARHHNRPDLDQKRVPLPQTWSLLGQLPMLV